MKTSREFQQFNAAMSTITEDAPQPDTLELTPAPAAATRNRRRQAGSIKTTTLRFEGKYAALGPIIKAQCEADDRDPHLWILRFLGWANEQKLLTDKSARQKVETLNF